MCHRILIIVLVCLRAQVAAAQAAHITLYPEKTQILYVGVENPLVVSVCQGSCKELVLSSPDGTTIQKGNCAVDIIPRNPGITRINVLKVSGKDSSLVAQFSFRTRFTPPPLARLGAYGGSEGAYDTISAPVLRAQLGITAGLRGFDFDVVYDVYSYSLMIVSRAGSVQEFTSLRSPFFTDSMKAAIGKMRAGDRIIVTGIKADGPVQKQVSLNPILLFIKE